MDKETLQYLANLASVRSYANQIMSVSRSNINQKDLHSISARTTQLDKLFCDVLLGRTKVPGSSASVLTTEEDDDLKTISQRLAEEKQKIVAKNSAPKPIKIEEKLSDDDEDSFDDEDEQAQDEPVKSLTRPKIKINKK